MIFGGVIVNSDHDHAQDDDNNSGDQFEQTRNFESQGSRERNIQDPKFFVFGLIKGTRLIY